MATTFNAQAIMELGWSWVDDDGTTRDKGSLSVTQRIADGNGDDEAEAVWHVHDQTLLSGGSITYDLTDLSRTLFETSLVISLLTVRAIAITVSSESEGSLIVGSAASDEWSALFGNDGDTLILTPSGMFSAFHLVDGLTVDDTHKNLKLAAPGGDVIYDIAIIGTTTEAASDSSSSAA